MSTKHCIGVICAKRSLLLAGISDLTKFMEFNDLQLKASLAIWIFYMHERTTTAILLNFIILHLLNESGALPGGYIN